MSLRYVRVTMNGWLDEGRDRNGAHRLHQTNDMLSRGVDLDLTTTYTVEPLYEPIIFADGDVVRHPSLAVCVREGGRWTHYDRGIVTPGISDEHIAHQLRTGQVVVLVPEVSP